MHLSKFKFNIRYFENRKLSNAAFIIFVVFCFSYLYFLKSSVVYVVLRERIFNETLVMQTEVSKLEAEYIKIRNNINMESAVKLGFVEDFNNINFANIDSGLVKGGLSFLGNEI